MTNALDPVDLAAGLFRRSDAAGSRLVREALRAVAEEIARSADKPEAAPTPCPLSSKQLDVIRWLSLGKTAIETAEICGISRHTAHDHVRNAMNKTGTANSTGLVAECLRRGWIV